MQTMRIPQGCLGGRVLHLIVGVYFLCFFDGESSQEPRHRKVLVVQVIIPMESFWSDGRKDGKATTFAPQRFLAYLLLIQAIERLSGGWGYSALALVDLDQLLLSKPSRAGVDSN